MKRAALVALLPLLARGQAPVSAPCQAPCRRSPEMLALLSACADRVSAVPREADPVQVERAMQFLDQELARQREWFRSLPCPEAMALLPQIQAAARGATASGGGCPRLQSWWRGRMLELPTTCARIITCQVQGAAAWLAVLAPDWRLETLRELMGRLAALGWRRHGYTGADNVAAAMQLFELCVRTRLLPDLPTAHSAELVRSAHQLAGGAVLCSPALSHYGWDDQARATGQALLVAILRPLIEAELAQRAARFDRLALPAVARVRALVDRDGMRAEADFWQERLGQPGAAERPWFLALAQRVAELRAHRVVASLAGSAREDGVAFIWRQLQDGAW